VHPAREARDDLAPNRFDYPELLKNLQLFRDRRPGASGRLGDRVIARETLKNSAPPILDHGKSVA
jgi:hypothetical protein